MYYTRSNGQRVLLAEMPTPHLRSAFFKLLREDPTSDEIADMRAEVRKRAVEWRDELVAAQAGDNPKEYTEIDEKIAKVDEELAGVLASE